MSTGQYDKDAVETLQLLDVVIRQIHPDRFFGDVHEAVPYVNPPRIAVNAFLGRPPTERFFPIEYEAVLSRFAHYVNKNLAAEAMKLSEQMPMMHALMRGVRHEYKLRRVLGKPHDQFNLGREVESTTKTLIDCLNQGASTRPEPMPSS
jgi:hypothetical protein